MWYINYKKKKKPNTESLIPFPISTLIQYDFAALLMQEVESTSALLEPGFTLRLALANRM